MKILFDRLSPYFVAILSAIVAVCCEAVGIKLSFPSLPISWGLIKDIADMFVVLFLVWNGWIAVPPLLMSLHLRWRYSQVLTLMILLSVVMGVADTYISFDGPTIERCLKGTVLYLFVFAAITALGYFVSWLTLTTAKLSLEKIRG